MSFEYYLPVIRINELTHNRPIRVYLGNMPIVLIQFEKQVVAYEDFCPHRGAPLSEGTVVDGQIQCPYHGWQFNLESGKNTFVPVRNEKLPCQLQSVFVKVAYDLVWISYYQDATLPLLNSEVSNIILKGNIRALILNTLENFLEGSHTHYVHNGLVRTKNKQRNAIKANIQNDEFGFTVQYDLEPAKGLLTKLLPKSYQNLQPRSIYIHPNIAILEYKNEEQKVIARFEAILIQGQNELNYIARIFLNIGWIGRLIEPIIRLMFKKIIEQDKQILELQQDNLEHFKDKRFVSDETDTVGKYLWAWQNGNGHILTRQNEFIVYW